MIEQVGLHVAPLLGALHALTFERPWSAADFAKLLSNPATFALLARTPAAQGFALVWAAAGDAELLTVSVVPEARRQGVGAALVEKASILARARGAATLHLEVEADNAAARALYAKLDFAEVGRRPGYYAAARGAIDAIVMRKSLVGLGP